MLEVPTAVTTTPFEEIWQLFRQVAEESKETNRRFQETEQLLKAQGLETDRRFQETEQLLKAHGLETDRRFQETEQLLKAQGLETDRRFQETERRFQEAERRFQETEQLLKTQGLETDRRFQETERLLKELTRDTDRKLREVSQDIGRLGNRLGQFIEEAVRPAAVRLFNQRNIAVNYVYQNVIAKRNGAAMEIDLLVVNTNTLVAIECKSKLDLEDVQSHLERLEKLKSIFPHYADYRVLGAIAAMVIPDKVAAYAYQYGLYLICPNGEDLYISNDATFVPKEW